MVTLLAPLPWAQRQFGDAELGDKRRTKRAVAYAAAAAAGPSQSVPRQCDGEWKQTKGAYRLFDQAQVTLDRLQKPHRQLTLQQASARQVVLWVSDTTTLSFEHPATEGLGATSAGGSDASPFVLGLGHQQVWARRGEKDQAHPESEKWALGVQALGSPPPNARWVHVGDAESDCWEAIETCVDSSLGFAVRACQDRQVIAGHEWPDDLSSAQTTTLFELLRQQPAMGNKKLWVRSRPGRAADWATLAVSALAITLLAPKHWSEKPHRRDKPRPEPILCWALRIHQINTPQGQEPIEWIILTDEPLDRLEAALKVSFWYSCRWLIEEYHKCLKTGCRMEERQLEEADRLKALLGILAVVAVRLLQLKHQAKMNPTVAASRIVPTNYVQTLAAYLKQSPEKMTARQFWIETARLGGFLARKGDGDPGWLTLWQGWQQLETLTEGFELAKGIKGKCVQ